MNLLKYYRLWRLKRWIKKEAERKAAFKRLIEVGIPAFITMFAINEIIKFTKNQIKEFEDKP